MIEVVIPVYKARKTLPKALDSLVAQTKDNFIVCLSIDGDGEDYEDIIEEYKRRGLKMRVIRSEENGGPGIARQRGLDTTICDYITFLDSDDMFMPRAVERLYTEAKLRNLDIMRSAFIRESNAEVDTFIAQNVNTITWMHGKVYKVAFLREKNIRFLEGQRIDEDAYFNLLAWNSTQNKAELDEYVYIWRNNKSSLTRQFDNQEYFKRTYLDYIHSQTEGLKRLYAINHSINHSLITQTLLNIHFYYMTARFMRLDEKAADEMISSLRGLSWMNEYLADGNAWVDLVKNGKVGDFYLNQYVVFYEERIDEWIVRLLKDPTAG